MKQNPGMRIVTGIKRLPPAIIEAYRDIPAANISDATYRLFAMDAALAPMGRCKKVVGTALTVKSAIADNLLFHKALSMAQPGDVVVVNACGDTHHSVCGDVMFRYARSRGVAGMVIDGCVRDLDYLAHNDFPVFAIGATPRGPYKNPVGEINTVIACCGQVVHPGDLVVGDEDGVVVVRREDVETVLEKVRTVLEKEQLMGELIDSGRWDSESPLLQLANKEIEAGGFEVVGPAG